MLRQRIISFMLFSFIVWNTVLGGAGDLLLCSHHDGDAHLVGEYMVDCHGENEAETAFFSHCDDFELAGVDLLTSSRHERLVLMASQCALTGLVPEHLPRFEGVWIKCLPNRGPPLALAQSILVVQTTVLRL
ncbi:hypothetical protein [Cerasicoccus arenae]|uniref:hypothetical protein n=1 Tax=Cerasicoccus arenae TaxID=424488 RepID=UPI0016792509|nr:hypothetical protein [Cerasicoccus arenae]MBK1859723.1 hypothetical protein [Cerasicoccus arenae]